MFYDGLEGCGAFYLILHNGKVLDGIANDAGYGDHWSPSGRYVCGIAGPEDRLWVADAWLGRIVSNLRKLKLSEEDKKWLARIHKIARE